MHITRALKSALILAALVSTPPSVRAYFAGGGKDATKGNDCLIGYDVISLDDVTLNGKNQVVECTDCDPACDKDGSNEANGSCTFEMGVCINQPGVEGCDEPAALDKATAKGKVKGVKGSAGKILIEPSPLAGSVCWPHTEVIVPIRGSKNPRGSANLGLSAVVKKDRVGGIRKRTDVDKLTYVCLPREGECPATTTTTVGSTIPSTTATSTSSTNSSSTEPTSTVTTTSSTSLTITTSTTVVTTTSSTTASITTTTTAITTTSSSIGSTSTSTSTEPSDSTTSTSLPETTTTTTTVATSVTTTSTFETSTTTTSITTTTQPPELSGVRAVPSVVIQDQPTTIVVSASVRGDGAPFYVVVVSPDAPDVELGILTDDGIGDDQTADDSVYTGLVELDSPLAPTVPLRVVVSTGDLPVEKDFEIAVVPIPVLTTEDEVNQGVTEVYETALGARDLLQEVLDGTSTDVAGLGAGLRSLFATFSAVTAQLPAPSGSALSRSALSLPPPLPGQGLWQAGQKIEACTTQLVKWLPCYSPRDPDAPPPDDSRVVAFVNAVLNAAPGGCGGFTTDDFYDCSSPPISDALILCARNTALTKPLPGVSGCDDQAAIDGLVDAAIKEELSQPTNLISSGLGGLFDLGRMSVYAVGYGLKTFVGWFVDQYGQTHPIIGSADNDEEFDAPSGEYNLVVSVDGSSSPATVVGTDVPSGPDLTAIDLLPGTIVTSPTKGSTCGATPSGHIGVQGQADFYAFDATAGEAVTVVAVPTSGFLCPHVVVLAPDGSPIGYNVPCEGPSPSLALTATGRYVVIVSDDDGAETGDYNFNLQFTTGRCATSSLSCGEVYAGGVIGKAAEVDALTFDASEGDIVNLAAATVLGSPACAKLRLFDSNGMPRGDTLCNGSVDSPPLHNGPYTLLISDDNFHETGNYAVGLQTIKGAQCATAISCGQTLPGAITQTAQLDAYTFEGATGQGGSFQAFKTNNGAACIEASLYAPSGTFVGGTFCSGTFYFSSLPESGTYTIFVYDEGLQASGNYTLNFTCSSP